VRNYISSIAAVSVVTSFLLPQNVLQISSAEASVIRDTEIEHTIREYASPLLIAAGIEARDLGLHITKDKAMNAFVAGGQHIYVTTGLLTAAKHPGQIQGVLAHEIGHITGGHLARLRHAVSNRRKEALVGQLIGVAIGLLGKNSSLTAATGLKAQDIALKKLHKFSRTQERSADQVAIKLLNQAQISARGLLEFLTLLEGQELLVRARQDPYLITHPLTRARINFVRNQVKSSDISKKPTNPELMARHRRMVAKLRAFLYPPSKTLAEYSSEDEDANSRYARAIALYRISRSDEAVDLMRKLIKQSPHNPYFHELKGQILFESGKLTRALPSYEKAVRLKPSASLLRVRLAHLQIELQTPSLNKSAIKHLIQALRYDRTIPLCWRLASIAYGRNNQLGMSALMLAEYNQLTGSPTDARQQANKAIRILPKNSPGWIRAQDILRQNPQIRQDDAK